MNNLSKRNEIELPLWLKLGATIFAIVGLVALAVIEINGTYNLNWLSFVLVALIYIPIQIITESILSVYWESPKWLIKIIPVIFLVSFYAALLWFK